MIQTYTTVEGEAYRGTVSRERRVNFYLEPYLVTRMSADLGNDRWVYVEMCSEVDSPMPIDVLRKELAKAIKARLG